MAVDVSAARQARLLFSRSLADAPALPPFSHAVHGSQSPALLVTALEERGFTASLSAYDGDGAKAGSRRVRTNAPDEVLQELGIGIGRSVAKF